MEFGWKGVTDSPLTGITRNPWNLDRTPGSSSRGAAVTAALGWERSTSAPMVVVQPDYPLPLQVYLGSNQRLG